MSRSKFYDQVHLARIEREVEDVYNKGISFYFDNPTITHQHECDGYVETRLSDGKMLRLIIEYKFNEEFSKRIARSKVLLQVIFYLKRFEQSGEILPNVILVGDQDECFVIHTNDVIEYLDEKLDWSIAPSKSSDRYPSTVWKISQDERINPFVFVVNEEFSFKVVAEKIIDLARNVQRYVRVTEHNIAGIFEYFLSRVVKNSAKIPANKLVSIFLGTILNHEKYYQHPSNKNILVADGEHLDIDGPGFVSFFSYFNRNYTPQEKSKFTEISDRLIEDVNRRRKGEFYTPTPFVDRAHEMLSSVLGPDWRDKYVVWDNCWGTGNLTRDYRFAELYASTLEPGELQIGERYNKEATKFVFDFLNSPIEDTLLSKSDVPTGLRKAFEEKRPIVWLLNPPYGRSGTDSDGSKGKKGIAKGAALTKINKMMKDDGIGPCSANLYSQFLYRIMKITEHYGLSDVTIGLFCKPNYLSGETFSKFRQKFLSMFRYEKGMLFNAGYFSGVSSLWGINFSVWRSGVTDDKNVFVHDLVEFSDGELIAKGMKSIYNLDGIESVSNWCRTKVKDMPLETITLKSGIVAGTKVKKTSSDIICWLTNGNNNVGMSADECYFMQCPNDRGKTNVAVTEENYRRCAAVFGARRTIAGNWINDKDEFMAPDESKEGYDAFVNDCIVFSLFNTASYQTSLRRIELDGREWNIENKSFFMSRAEMMSLAEKWCDDVVFEDARTAQDGYVYKQLESLSFSKEARAVLDKARELVSKSFQFRQMFDEEHPEYHIRTWNAGWYQVKALVKQYLHDNEYESFMSSYHTLASSIRERVYKYGFLR